MGNNREEQRGDLRKRLIGAAEARIVAGGLEGLKAREVTADAGCALGMLYIVFDDLDRLVLQVNSRTLARLGVALAAAVPEGAAPKEVMAALAQGYLGFALNNFRLWSALFTHRLPHGVAVPEWHKLDHEVLFAQIIAPLGQLRPDLRGAELQQRAITVFAAVHGVVMLALTGRFFATPRNALAGEVAALVDAMMRGLAG